MQSLTVNWKINLLPAKLSMNAKMENTLVSCKMTRNSPWKYVEVDIDVENNPYYEKLHEKIKADKNNKNSNYSKYYTKDGKINVTAAQNGALECSKCHY